MARKQSKQPDWDAIRAACQKKNRSSFADIAAAYGVSVATLRKRRKLWQMQSGIRNQTPETVTSGNNQPGPDRSNADEVDHLSMVQRLYTATDQQIRHLEQQLKNGSAAYDEKEARMLGTIARTLDKIMELSPLGGELSGEKKDGANGNDDNDDGGSLDVLREELARRLDGLKQGSAGELSGEPQTQ